MTTVTIFMWVTYGVTIRALPRYNRPIVDPLAGHEMAEALVQLNANWRVADDPPQWALQCRDGPKREKASGWAGSKFIRNRDHLLRRIEELCGNVDPQAIEIIR